VSQEKTTRKTGAGPGALSEQDELERRELRELIDRFRGEPGSGDEGGFYRNVGRIIVRPLMQLHWPGNKKH
jgi:hypothetical protein